MSKNFYNFLFDPEDIEKTLGLQQDKSLVFPRLRLSTDPGRTSKKGPESDAWYERWEQMICQLQNKANELFKLNPSLNFVTNSKLVPIKSKKKSGGAPAPNKNDFVSGKWESDSYMCGDLLILDELDSEIYTLFKKDILTGVPMSEIMLDHYEFAPDSSKREDLEFIDEVKSGMDFTIETSVGYLSKSGMLGNFTSKPIKNPMLPGPGSESDGSKINIIRIVSSSHYTIALHYEDDNRLEYFDPGGVSDSLVYVEGVPISGRLSQKSKLRDYKSESVICDAKKTEHLMVCRILSNILRIRSPYFVSINTKELQILDEDIYCHTWVLLYVYMRHVYPKMSAEECSKYFESKTKNPSQLFYIILNWWDYLLYLDPSIWPEDFESQYKSLLSKDGGNRKKSKK